MALARRPVEFGVWVKWEIGEPLPAQCTGVDAVVHLASASLLAPKKLEEAVAADLLGTKVLAESVRACAASGAPPRFVFLSSQSASSKANNAYGKCKFAIEGGLTAANEVIVRPGLVYDDAGASVFGLFERLSRLPVVPIVSSRPNIQPIHVAELIECLVKICSTAHCANLYLLGATEPMTFAGAIKATARRFGRSAPLGIPVPLAPVRAAAWTIDKILKLRPTIAERLDGLIALRPMDTAPSLAMLDVQLKNFEVSH
jgi:nucleoside-diphosphate-sugar epimerase